MKVALVYDRVNKWGGAERVLLSLHKLFPQAPLYTSVYNKKSAPWGDNFTIKTSFLQKIPYTSSSHEYFPLLMPLAFESFAFDEYDVVISVTSEAAKGIITKPSTLHICYCLTPTRYLWSGYDEYFRNPIFRFVTKPAVSYLRQWDSIAGTRPDVMIAISEEVKRRIKTYYKREADVIYPPVFLPNDIQASSIKDRDYFLIVSRLVPYKKIDLAIAACNRLQLPLKIVGKGSDDHRLRQLAGPTVELLGLLTQEKLVAYYKNCKALLFPGIEDFGLTVVEAQRFGKPVIAFAGGGAIETIVEGKTGLFFSPQTEQALAFVLQSFDQKTFHADDCRKQAEKFSQKTFQKNFSKKLETLLSQRNTQI